MRNKIIIMIFVAMPLLMGSFVANPDNNVDSKEKRADKKIEFIDDWDLAMELAKKEGKLIYLDAMASWCGPCKIMDKKTFADPDVAAFFNENFINVKMDMEKNSHGQQLMKKYEIVAYPSSVFIDHKGNMVKKEIGFMDAGRFLEYGKSVVEK